MQKRRMHRVDWHTVVQCCPNSVRMRSSVGGRRCGRHTWRRLYTGLVASAAGCQPSSRYCNQDHCDRLLLSHAAQVSQITDGTSGNVAPKRQGTHCDFRTLLQKSPCSAPSPISPSEQLTRSAHVCPNHWTRLDLNIAALR